jgi:hypothetical protein
VRHPNFTVTSRLRVTLCYSLDLSLTSLILRAPRSVYALAISALILLYILRRVIPRLMALGAIHVFNGVSIGSSYITVLLIAKALPHTSRPII